MLARKTMREICSAAVDSLAGARHVLDEAMVPTWGRYVIGCLVVLIHHGRWPALCQESWAIRVESDVPLGMGVSSSAAIEVATLRALGELKKSRGLEPSWRGLPSKRKTKWLARLAGSWISSLPRMDRHPLSYRSSAARTCWRIQSDCPGESPWSAGRVE